MSSYCFSGARFSFARIDSNNVRLQFFDVALVLGADKSSDNCVNCLGNIHEGFRRLLAVFRVSERTGRSSATSTNILF